MDIKDSLSLIVLAVDELVNDIELLTEDSSEKLLDKALLKAHKRLLKSDFNDKDLHESLFRLERGLKRLKLALVEQQFKPSSQVNLSGYDQSEPF